MNAARERGGGGGEGELLYDKQGVWPNKALTIS